MTRSELEHIIRAASAISEDHEVVIIGSQSILGQFPDAPLQLLASMEADVYPKNKPQLADLVDGSIGEGSMFHETYGYYAQGVGPETARLPNGWEARAVRIKNANTGNGEGVCLEVHDLAISKYVAGREKDMAFNKVLVKHNMVKQDKLLKRLAQTKLSDDLNPVVSQRIKRDFL